MGKLTLVSTGAGGTRYITQEAINAIQDADLIVSYTKYAKDLKEYIGEKELFTSGMTKEIERVSHAVEAAREGRNVALISNGDANVYAMGSLVVELLDVKDYWGEVEYKSLAGISSVLALASEVGAPLSQDFCLISLSDRLTDSDLIQRRIAAAIDVDMVIAIYNPKSKSRLEPYRGMLEKLKGVDGSRPIVVARDLGRENQMVKITTAKEIIEAGVENEEVNMSTTLLIGNSTTKLTKDGRVLTPRGYLNKYELSGSKKDDWKKIN
ncbi:precorrin-3B C(17)-methyltransferase [Sulfurimonas sp. SAG-AH-194-I05]|nr:precorrin-3B C(17)-methyltransferase [Sulfurimonas sp. SAG-AH-194-I05]MDF1875896.1 precorrin-3B C(17)-methyltransferase [Sulfurimonas sp. SAG-AH-194-I05]